MLVFCYCNKVLFTTEDLIECFVPQRCQQKQTALLTIQTVTNLVIVTVITICIHVLTIKTYFSF